VCRKDQVSTLGVPGAAELVADRLHRIMNESAKLDEVPLSPLNLESNAVKIDFHSF
jgi:hypothetical protein